jgi:hypothetical protein
MFAKDPNTPTNAQRASWAQSAINHYRKLTGPDDDQTACLDLLADLMHWCAKRKLSFERLSERAARHYQEEQTTRS